VSRFPKYEPPAGTQVDEQRRSAADVSFDRATREDLPALAEITAEREGESADRWLESFGRTLDRASTGSALVLVARSSGEIAAYGKVERHVLPEPSLKNAAPAGWYLAGVIVRPEHRRRGIGAALTGARLDWIAGRARTAHYFANARNQASVDLHAALGFREISRDFHHPHAHFEGGAGILFACDVSGRSFLETERLRFRLWREGNIDLAVTLWGDPDVTRFIDSRPQLSREAVEERLAREIESQRDHEIQYWPMFLRESGDLAGCCGLRPHDVAGRVYELGVHVRRAHWGKGLALEASRAVIAHAFQARGAVALFAGHHPENRTSGHLLERLGFHRTHEELYPPTGLMHPSYRLEAPSPAPAES
jgi:RimJ/RimL family protein N-acetyltransferase